MALLKRSERDTARGKSFCGRWGRGVVTVGDETVVGRSIWLVLVDYAAMGL